MLPDNPQTCPESGGTLYFYILLSTKDALCTSLPEITEFIGI